MEEAKDKRIMDKGPCRGSSKQGNVQAVFRKARLASRLFRGTTGSPRTGIIDAIAFRISKGNADVLDLRLVQLKGGKAGISGAEIGRLKKAVGDVEVGWLIAAYDGKTLHLLPNLES